MRIRIFWTCSLASRFPWRLGRLHSACHVRFPPSLSCTQTAIVKLRVEPCRQPPPEQRPPSGACRVEPGTQKRRAKRESHVFWRGRRLAVELASPPGKKGQGGFSPRKMHKCIKVQLVGPLVACRPNRGRLSTPSRRMQLWTFLPPPPLKGALFSSPLTNYFFLPPASLLVLPSPYVRVKVTPSFF